MVETQNKVCVLGSGFAGLITAKTLLDDGFDVEILTCDASPGGVWSRERIYPGLTINNVHGEFRFSCLHMSRPEDANATGGRLSGEDMCAYAERFADKFLAGRIRYDTLVTRIRRDSKGGEGWLLDIRDLGADKKDYGIRYAKLVLCTGGCHTPKIPNALSPDAAARAGFRGSVFHSRDLRARIKSFCGENERPRKVVIIGGGRSAQDVAKHLVGAGHKVTMIFEGVDAVLATPSVLPLPPFIRRSRFLSILAGHCALNSRLERFLHTTKIGATIAHGILNSITAVSHWSLGITPSSPVHPTASLFWDIRINDEGAAKKNDFFALANSGQITLITPARAVGYELDGRSILLNDGRTVEADLVVLATGYKSSWDGVLDDVREELGFNESRQEDDDAKFAPLWQDYTSLAHPPQRVTPTETKAGALYRGLVPVSNLPHHDFAINGAIFTTNNGYIYEIGAHWISSYFLRDPFLQLPSSVEDAKAEARMAVAWIRKRYPQTAAWANESNSSRIAFWDWPQMADDLLRDMGLRTQRSGGGWLTWPFAVIDLDEIATLGEERRALREGAA